MSTPLMRLRDAHDTTVVLVTLPEPTPVEAASWTELRRGIEPCVGDPWEPGGGRPDRSPAQATG